ncbi:hypothetical protein NFI96_020875 [Prochilodus magdalenae]|nr:hypothetical protein NFI96_020875 [Prochilodus magdalenae]
MEMEILDKLAQEVFALKVYPEKYEIESVASELVSKHPCLKEPGGGTGYDDWTTSIKYKLGNYRSKLHQAGCNKVTDPEDGQTKGVKMGILTVLDDDDSTTLPTVVNIAIVLERSREVWKICEGNGLFPSQIFQTSLLRLPTFLASSMP